MIKVRFSICSAEVKISLPLLKHMLYFYSLRLLFRNTFFLHFIILLYFISSFWSGWKSESWSWLCFISFACEAWVVGGDKGRRRKKTKHASKCVRSSETRRRPFFKGKTLGHFHVNFYVYCSTSVLGSCSMES